MSFYIIGITESCRRLAVASTPERAAEYIGKLPNALDGIYYIDGPCIETVELENRSEHSKTTNK